MSDLKSTTLAADGSVSGGPTRLRAVLNGATAGTLEVRDGGASGTVLATMTLAANAYVDLPGALRCETDCYANLTTIDDITFFYSG